MIYKTVSYTHLRAHETPEHLVCRLLLEKIGGELKRNSCLVIGGFQKGHFSESTQNNFDNLYSIGDTSFEGHVVVSRMLYEYEKTIFM